MAINKNHEFEELDGIKCAIVEKNISNTRAMFLKDLLVHNGYTVVIIPASPPKVGANPVATIAAETGLPPQKEVAPPAPELFVLGVTDLRFNAINAIFGRLLKTTDGRVVTQAYWNQQETTSHDEVPYYEHTKLPGTNKY